MSSPLQLQIVFSLQIEGILTRPATRSHPGIKRTNPDWDGSAMQKVGSMMVVGMNNLHPGGEEI